MEVVLFAALLLWLCYLVLRAVWRAAEARGQSGPLWVLLFPIAPFLSTIILLVFFRRQPDTMYDRPSEEEPGP